MTYYPRWAGAAVLTAMLMLSACAKGPPPARLPSAPAVSAAAIDGVQSALISGDEREAKKQLKPLLKREPMNPSLLLLQQALQGDAKEALGPANYPYKVRAGDTIESIASRLLGNRLKAYELARYNDLTFPVQLAPGQSLRIPGAAPSPKPQPTPERPRPKPAPVPPASAKPGAVPTPPPSRSAGNPAQAQRARAAGLAALNRGSVGQAVAQLERAQSLDPGNVQIQRDLQRARRIAATVKARK